LAPGADQWEAQRALLLIYSMTPGESVRDREEALRVLDPARNFQAEEKPSQWGAVRVIKSNRLLMIEFALSTFLKEAGFWAYHLARRYAERYDSQYGTLFPN